jgi:hemerythrin-like domain-containing protein
MKRHPALAPLSRDHHKALVIAMTLERAGAEGAREAAERYVDFLGMHEVGHFALEEAVLLPVVPAGEPGRSLVERVLDDHRWLREACARLERAREPPDPDRLHELGARLRAHVQLEERELFPYLERSLDEATLARVGERLAVG